MQTSNAATSYPAIVGTVLRARRDLQDVSAAAMADAAGFATRSGWTRVESGETTPTANHIRMAARRLGCQPWEIVRDADAMAARLEAAGVVVLGGQIDDGQKLLHGPALLALAAFLAQAQSPEEPT